MKRLLVIDPDPQLRAELARVSRIAGYEAHEAANGAAALRIVATRAPEAALLDVGSPQGLDILDALATRAPELGVIAMSAEPAVERIVEALRRGAEDFLRKPFPVRALERSLATLDARLAVRNAPGGAAGSGGLLTEDPRMRALVDELGRAAATDATIRIVGESGTGKEMLARLVHQRSRRAAGPLVVVNCAGLHESLAESELFGHERGSFTGAIESRTGQIAAAHGGSLVLDEVSDLGPGLQPKLLRALQEREVVPIGSSVAQPVDVRIVATTQRDLGNEVLAGRFREDLYYRLDVITFQVPPLRERPADIPVLARAFLERFAREAGSEPPRLGDAAVDALGRLAFRGNIRELENLMRRATVLFPGLDVDVERLRQPGAPARDPLATALRSLNLKELERAAVERSLTESGGNRTLASRALGISVRTLRNKIRAYQLA